MHALEYLKAPTSSGILPLYALFGDDAYLRSEALDAVVRAVSGGGEGSGVSRFAGESAALADVLDEVRTLPFLEDRRIAVVDGADPFVTRYRRELEAYAERPSTSGTLVLSVKAWPSHTKLAKAFEKNGLSIECKAPAERELGAWLTRLVQERHGAKIDGDAAALLIELIGPEVGLLAAELEKLATFAGAGAPIRRADVARMVGNGRVESIWAILEAATTGKGGEALAEVDRLVASGEHPVGLLAQMSGSLRRLHHAGELRRARRDLAAACKEAGLPWGAAEKVKAQHAHLGPARVSRIPRALLQADLDLKGSSTLPPRVVLERLLIHLARPRQD